MTPTTRRFEIGPGLTCDLDLLIASRLLVQASSGLSRDGIRASEEFFS